jgi:membrane dipeptidase
MFLIYSLRFEENSKPEKEGFMPLIVDAHQDLAWNTLVFARDYTRPVGETRQKEKGSAALRYNGNTLLGRAEYASGEIGLIFATLFAPPVRMQIGAWDKLVYRNANEAHRLYRQQIDFYRRLTEAHPDHFGLVRNLPDLDLLLSEWQNSAEEQAPPTGLLLLMEGAEGIRSPQELEEWWELGLRLIGPAWVGTRFCGGWREPAPLTDEGRELLAAMAEFRFILDLSHMDEAAVLEALDRYEGALLASHSNAAALLPRAPGNRHLSDRVIRGIIERDGVIGIVPFNAYLQAGWRPGDERVSLTRVVDQLDYICQLAGDARHVGIGSDFDGGFGVESVPAEINTIADLQKLAPLLAERGYTEPEIAAIFGKNFINLLKENLPAS